MDHIGNERSEEGTPMEMSTFWAPYRDFRPIRSAGRALLSEAFSEYIALTAGMSPLEIANAFGESGDLDDRDVIKREIHFLTGIFVEGRIRTYARLTGGGDPVELPAAAWEIDDAVPRFATASFNFERAHDPSAFPTHWIFVDKADWDAAMNGLRNSHLAPLEEWESDEQGLKENPPIIVVNSRNPEDIPVQNAGPATAHQPWRSEILRIEGVIEATGLKRSTIYAKVAAGTFPRQIPIHGSTTGWRRGDVQDWLDGLTD